LYNAGVNPALIQLLNVSALLEKRGAGEKLSRLVVARR
jgi:hypothetical protein